MTAAFWRLRTTLATAGIAILVGVVGCGNGQGAEEDEPTITVPTEVNALTLVLPLDSYMGTEAEAHAADRADDLLFLRCMRKYGFD